MRVLHETGSQFTVENLNHAADHLTDLIEQKGLAFEVEPDKFDGSAIRCISHFKCVLIDIHESISGHLHHIAHRRSLRRLNLLRVIVILLSASEFFPKTMHLLFLILRETRSVHLLDGFLGDVLDRSVCFDVELGFILHARHTSDLLYA